MIPENWREEILKLADSYCESEGIKRTVLSNRVAGDADFLDHLADGGGCTTDKYFNVLKWLRDNPPVASQPAAKNSPRKKKKVNGHG